MLTEPTLLRFLKGMPDGGLPSSGSPEAVRLRCKLGVFCRLAEGLAGLSTCKRMSVGAALVEPDLSAVAGVGYNGQPAGLPNDGCTCEVGACGCVHAEANALLKAGRNADGRWLLISTWSPCRACAGLIINSRSVGAVFYRDEYRNPEGVGVLRRAGIVAVQWWFSPDGLATKGGG